MITIVGYIFLIFAIFVHELGHAYASRKHNIEIHELSVGFGYKLFTFYATIPRWNFYRLPIHIRLFPLGGFVSPTRFGGLRQQLLPYNKFGEILGAGVAMNYMLAAFMFFIYWLTSTTHPISYLMVVIGIFLLGYFNKYTFHLMIPIGIAVMWYLLKDVFSSPAEFVQNSGGVVAVSQGIHQAAEKGIRDLILYGATISLGLAVMNSVPFYPLDGGQILVKGIHRLNIADKKNGWVYLLASVPFIVLILVVVGSDIWRLVKMVI